MHAANNLFSISDAQIWSDIYFIIFVEINGSQTNFSKLRWMWLLLLHASLVIKKLPLILLMLTMDCYKILQISWEVHHGIGSASFATPVNPSWFLDPDQILRTLLHKSVGRDLLVRLFLVRSSFCVIWWFIYNSWRLQFQLDVIAYYPREKQPMVSGHTLVFNISFYYQTQTPSLGFGMRSFEVCYALFISVWGNGLCSYQYLTDHQHVVFKSLEGHVHKHALLTEQAEEQQRPLILFVSPRLNASVFILKCSL